MLRRKIPPSLLWLIALALISIAVAFAAGVTLYWQSRSQNRIQAEAIAQGNAERGKNAIYRYGCAACHTIQGIRGANGQVGPDLTYVARRAVIAGSLLNEPNTMVRWLMHPQVLKPGSGMPEVGVSEPDARDMVAYLYSTS